VIVKFYQPTFLISIGIPLTAIASLREKIPALNSPHCQQKCLPTGHILTESIRYFAAFLLVSGAGLVADLGIKLHARDRQPGEDRRRTVLDLRTCRVAVWRSTCSQRNRPPAQPMPVS
jgi:hypothetical protein